MTTPTINPILQQAANASVASDLAFDAHLLLFKAALTVGDPARIQAARQAAIDTFEARLDAHAALYATDRQLGGRV
ncbi:hypothetical protein J2847_006432 [Azospirillum agricola]|uniref:hypothetical protein n=1 Tax=Azospirillum agricola TaxID=1720247 RepID=UPI001AEA9027|nr:hypothetical protein [Azospirillum agricola]MBP2233097.1 hypothetical protein [Azospirillum agricola]